MSRLTAELVIIAPQFTNTLKDRELDLRSNKISLIENLGATLDQFDTIDLSDNDIRRLDGFPQLKRLRTLFLNNNRVSRIGTGLGENLPNLEEVVLTNNSMAELGDLMPLFECKKLTHLSFLHNPVTASEHYRAFLIYHLPNLRLLDFQKVTGKEREAAAVLFDGPAGDAVLRDIVKHTHLDGKEAPAPEAKKVKVDPKKAAAQAKILEAIKNATTLEEVQRLEAQLKSGIIHEEHS